MRTYFLLLFVALLMFSCEDTFQYSPNEIVLEEDEINLNRKNLTRLQQQPFVDTLLFIYINDTHHSYEELDDFVTHMNQRNDVSFVIVGGDVTNFGLQWEYQEYHKLIKDLDVPYITIIGNHDLLGQGEKVYKKMFGELDFSFRYNGYKFICVNTNSREYNFNGLVPDINWLNNQLADSTGYSQCFVLSHIAPFDPDFDPELQNSFIATLANSKAKLSMHGHAGSYYYGTYFGDHIYYVVNDNMSERSYVEVKIWENSFTCERKLF